VFAFLLADLYFPPLNRFFRHLFSFTVIISLAIAVSVAVFFMIVFNKIFASNSTIASIIVGIVFGVQISALNYVYRRLALWLNEFENHRTESAYEEQLTIKLFIFQFINSFSSSFYIAYVKNNLSFFGLMPDPCQPDWY
jgi:hypothetical protein